MPSFSKYLQNVCLCPVLEIQQGREQPGPSHVEQGSQRGGNSAGSMREDKLSVVYFKNILWILYRQKEKKMWSKKQKWINRLPSEIGKDRWRELQVKLINRADCKGDLRCSPGVKWANSITCTVYTGSKESWEWFLSLVWQHMPLIPILRRQWQGDSSNFQTTVCYIEIFGQPGIHCKTLSYKKKYQKKMVFRWLFEQLERW